MAGTQTGLNPTEVNSCISTCNQKASEIWAFMVPMMQGIQTAVDENWGTQKGKEWITTSLTPDLQKVLDTTQKNLNLCGQAISETGKQQISDTENTQVIKGSLELGAKTIEANTKDILDNGFVGVYNELIEKIEEQTSKKEQLLSLIGEFQSQTISKCDAAFNKVGAADNVSEQLNALIQKIVDDLHSSLDNLVTNVKTKTADADTYAKKIQDAGLRSSGGGNGAATQ